MTIFIHSWPTYDSFVKQRETQTKCMQPGVQIGFQNIKKTVKTYDVDKIILKYE